VTTACDRNGAGTADSGHVGLRRFSALSASHVDEMTEFLDQQWHALVKADNLFGSRQALSGVREHLREHLEVIDALLGSVRSPARSQVLRLGARYAESAAWLCEDAAEITMSRHWTGQAMKWAVEGADDLMVAWTLFRSSQQAAAAGDVGAVARLTAKAWVCGGDMPESMRVAILQQEAHGHALARDEIACQRAIDRAMAFAAPDDDPGDASAGHGSFCTHGYLEMQRGICWTRLGHPSKALSAFEAALSSMPLVYRRDRGVALSGQAACLAALRKPGLAAAAAQEALVIAVESGSGRVFRMVMTVAATLGSSRRIPEVAALRGAVREAGSV